MTPENYGGLVQDPGTKITVSGATAKIVIGNSGGNRRSWGIVADTTNNDFITFSMGGHSALNADKVGDPCVAGTQEATANSFRLRAGQSFSEPIGGGAIYSGPVSCLANSGSQLIYTWCY